MLPSHLIKKYRNTMNYTDNREFVPSGTYSIKKTNSGQMVAMLATCIGVAIHDRENEVGGLLHLLLPEPTGGATAWQPLNYASTGLPLFLKELYHQGATRGNIEASIAGGALFGPDISALDMNLDIGGRTAEVVHNILKKEGISIVRSETGGYFGAKLILDTRTWQADIQPTIDITPINPKEFRKPSVEEIDAAIEHTHPIPQVALKIIRLLKEEDYDIKSLTKEINLDQVIVAKVLRLCNSPIIGATRTIDSLDHALLLLGGNHLLEIVVSASLDNFFTLKEGGYSLMRGGLYHHSLGVANAAKIIATFTGQAEPGTAYTAGILHDIGKVVLDHYISDSFPLFYRAARQEDKSDMVTMEKEIVGVDHQLTGKRLAKSWNLPENLAEVVALHHYPEQATISPELVHIVHLADILASCFMAGRDFEMINTKAMLARLDRIGISPNHLPIIIDRVHWNKIIFS